MAVTATCGGSAAFKATIGGAAWCDTFGAVASGVQHVLPSLYYIYGQSTDGVAIGISAYNIRGPGTYLFGMGPTVVGADAIFVDGGGGWATEYSGEAGTLTITTLSSSRIAGTFSFTAVGSMGGATGTKTVTGGSFDLALASGSTTEALAASAGSSLSATIAGTTYNASTIIGGLATNIFVASTSTSARELSIGGIVTGTGTYALYANGPEIKVINKLNPQTNSWSSNSGSGSFTLTAVTGPRLTGTFTATLGPMAGTQTVGTITVTGSFDLNHP